MAGLYIAPKLRPCLVGKKNEKALFHCWEHSANGVRGLIEIESGSVCAVSPMMIQFVDNEFGQYAFPEEAKEDQHG